MDDALYDYLAFEFCFEPQATETLCNVCGELLVYFEDTERYYCKDCDMEFVESD